MNHLKNVRAPTYVCRNEKKNAFTYEIASSQSVWVHESVWKRNSMKSNQTACCRLDSKETLKQDQMVRVKSCNLLRLPLLNRYNLSDGLLKFPSIQKIELISRKKNQQKTVVIFLTYIRVLRISLVSKIWNEISLYQKLQNFNKWFKGDNLKRNWRATSGFTERCFSTRNK